MRPRRNEIDSMQAKARVTARRVLYNRKFDPVRSRDLDQNTEHVECSFALPTYELAKHGEECRLKMGRVDGTPCCGTISACFQSMFFI